MTDIITLDYETFWAPKYSLSKLTGIEYILDGRFELISCATKVNDGPSVVTFGIDETVELFETLDWRNAVVVAHNGAEFDHLITEWRVSPHMSQPIRPKLWADTLQMARPIHQKAVGGSLAALAAQYGLQAKGDLTAGTLGETRGKRLADFTPAQIEAMREYNTTDTELCYALFRRLLPATRADELKLMDLTTRMLIHPQFHLDIPLLRRGLQAEGRRKERSLDVLAERLGYDDLVDDQGELVERGRDRLRGDLRSTAKFRRILEDLGAACPTKWSEKQSKAIPAVAKSDPEMQALLEHPDELVASAAEQRLAVSSSILETRLQRFIDTGRAFGGAMPIPLRYYGATVTGRWSGIMALNCQNLPRINPKAPKLSDVLRLSLRAPPGHKVVVVDLSGIELRVNHHLWQVPSSVAAYQQDPDADLYRLFAAGHLYHVPVEAVTDAQRQNAKVAQLQLGYQSGWSKFKDTARQYGVTLDAQESQDIVRIYRATYREIVAGWATCHNALSDIADGRNLGRPLDPLGLCRVVEGGIETPKGLIRYPNLRKRIVTVDDRQQTEWVYGNKETRKLYGGQCVENLCQHLSRYVFTDAILRFARTTLGKKYPLAHMVHDEVVYVVPDADAPAVLDAVVAIMSTPPDWWPTLVTAAKGDIADVYGAAK